MGIEAPSAFGGANSTFFTSILAIEELSKVDGNIGLFVDLQNTLMIPLCLKYGSDYVKDTYIKQLTANTVFFKNAFLYENIKSCNIYAIYFLYYFIFEYCILIFFKLANF